VWQIQAQGLSKVSFVSPQYEFFREWPSAEIGVNFLLYDPDELMIMVDWTYYGLSAFVKEYYVGSLLNMVAFHEERLSQSVTEI
jgi:hypothetical protein